MHYELTISICKDTDEEWDQEVYDELVKLVEMYTQEVEKKGYRVRFEND